MDHSHRTLLSELSARIEALELETTETEVARMLERVSLEESCAQACTRSSLGVVRAMDVRVSELERSIEASLSESEYRVTDLEEGTAELFDMAKGTAYAMSSLQVSTRILGSYARPFPPFLIPHRVPRGFYPKILVLTQNIYAGTCGTASSRRVTYTGPVYLTRPNHTASVLGSGLKPCGTR